VLELVTDPSSVDFGEPAPDPLDALEVLLVTNSGEDTLVVGDVLLAGEDPQSFRVWTDLCSGNALAVGQTCRLEVLFDPTEPGELDAFIQLPVTAGLAWEVPLSGTNTLGLIFADGFESGDTSAWSGTFTVRKVFLVPGVVDFGEVDLGADTPTSTVWVTNGTATEVAVGAVTVVGEWGHEFAVVDDRCSSGWLAPEASCSFGVTMLTVDDGVFSASVEVPVWAASERQSRPVMLSGTVRWP